jgi:hypothetical protein
MQNMFTDELFTSKFTSKYLTSLENKCRVAAAECVLFLRKDDYT